MPETKKITVTCPKCKTSFGSLVEITEKGDKLLRADAEIMKRHMFSVHGMMVTHNEILNDFSTYEKTKPQEEPKKPAAKILSIDPIDRGQDERLPDEITEWINSTKWTFAKSYADTWPHEYVVKTRSPRHLYDGLFNHIKDHGYNGKFYSLDIRYFDQDGYVYWAGKTDLTLEKAGVINRVKKEGSFEYKLFHGILPKFTKRSER